jgi:hypothetical protein
MGLRMVLQDAGFQYTDRSSMQVLFLAGGELVSSFTPAVLGKI